MPPSKARFSPLPKSMVKDAPPIIFGADDSDKYWPGENKKTNNPLKIRSKTALKIRIESFFLVWLILIIFLNLNILILLYL